jgi:hypothetical protein
MNPLEFIFLLIEKYVPVNPGRFEQLRQQAKLWYVGGISDHGEKMEPEGKKSKIGSWIIDKGEIWWVQIILAFVFLFAQREFHNFLTKKEESGTPGL